MNKILDVFRTYCDAYLEYLNNFLTVEKFVSYYDLNDNEVNSLRVAASSVRKEGGTYREIDWAMNRIVNTKFTEKEAQY